MPSPPRRGAEPYADGGGGPGRGVVVGYSSPASAGFYKRPGQIGRRRETWEEGGLEEKAPRPCVPSSRRNGTTVRIADGTPNCFDIDTVFKNDFDH